MLYVLTQPKSLPEKYQPRFPFWTWLHCGTHCGFSILIESSVLTQFTHFFLTEGESTYRFNQLSYQTPSWTDIMMPYCKIDLSNRTVFFLSIYFDWVSEKIYKSRGLSGLNIKRYAHSKGTVIFLRIDWDCISEKN